MNRQSGSQLPIPVTPKEPIPSQQPLLDGQFQTPPRQKRRSRDRFSGIFSAKTRTSPIWRPSTGHTPPTPQWPLPRVPISIRDENPALTRTYTRPRDAPRPPPQRSVSGGSSTTTLTNDPDRSPRVQEPSPATPPIHPLSPRSPASPPRPPYFPPNNQGTFFQTRYMNMALNIDKIPRSHNILANLFAWMILVAFVISPGNFISPSTTATISVKDHDSSSTIVSMNKIPSVPLLAICCILFFLGILGHTWLRWLHRRNYIWLMNRIYLPLMLNSLAGFISTLVIVNVQHNWWWSIAAYVTVSIEAGTLLLSAGMFFLLDFVLLGKLKHEHYNETSKKKVVDLVKAGKRPPFAPGSVV